MTGRLWMLFSSDYEQVVSGKRWTRLGFVAVLALTVASRSGTLRVPEPGFSSSYGRRVYVNMMNSKVSNGSGNQWTAQWSKPIGRGKKPGRIPLTGLKAGLNAAC